MCNVLENMVIGLLTGLISGGISGYLIYLITKNREKKYQVYLYWETFLFKAMDDCQMYIPSEALHYISDVGGSESIWYKAIKEILDLQNPYPIENREFSEQENKIAENVLIALEELGKWKKKNHLK